MFIRAIRRKPLPSAYQPPEPQQTRGHRLITLWRNWRGRAAHARQMHHLRDVTMDPHIAKNIGFPVTQPARRHLDMW